MAVKRYHVINGTLEKRFRPINKRKFQIGVQRIEAAPEAPEFDLGSDLAQIGLATGAGALGGAALGGVGAIGGAAVGLATGLTKVFGARKEAKDQFNADYDLWADRKSDELSDIAGLDASELITQQNQAAKKGVYATGTEEIEVEKDELIFTKTETGKYVLKADYKDGKTHNKGGEDYQAADGDIIFPGKDRKKVMKAYKSQDFPKLESMRMALPKDTKKGLAQDGLNIANDYAFLNQFGDKPAIDAQKQFEVIKQQISKGLLPPEYALQFMQQNPGLQNEQVPGTRGYETRVFRPEDSALTSMQRGLMEDLGLQFDNPAAGPDGPKGRTTLGVNRQARYPSVDPTASPNMGNVTMSSEDLEQLWGYIGGLDEPAGEAAITGKEKGKGKGKGKVVNPNANMPSSAAAIPYIKGGGLKDILQLGTFKPGGIDVTKANQISKSKVDLPGVQGLPGGQGGGGLAAGLGYASQGLSILSGMFTGETEIQKSTPIKLGRLKYTDTSNILRRESKINELVQASNARNISGGNVQNYLANRRQAGIANLRRQESINVTEYQRALGISNQNIGFGNQEALYNNQLLQRDVEANAANRAARSNIIRQGIGKLGELGGQIGQDALARENQELLAQAIGSGQYSAYGQFKGR